jgi:hypothetical protein
MQGVSTQIHGKKKTVWDVIGKVKSSERLWRCNNIVDVASCRWAFSEPGWEKRFTQPERCAVFGENGRRFLRVRKVSITLTAGLDRWGRGVGGCSIRQRQCMRRKGGVGQCGMVRAKRGLRLRKDAHLCACRERQRAKSRVVVGSERRRCGAAREERGGIAY